LRALKTTELPAPDLKAPTHPQCVSRSKLKRRRRNLLPSNKAPAAQTIINDTNCCQSMLATYPQTAPVQQMI
jgi:hypothetical protein